MFLGFGIDMGLRGVLGVGLRFAGGLRFVGLSFGLLDPLEDPGAPGVFGRVAWDSTSKPSSFARRGSSSRVSPPSPDELANASPLPFFFRRLRPMSMWAKRRSRPKSVRAEGHVRARTEGVTAKCEA